jgi:hypothetical protein
MTTLRRGVLVALSTVVLAACGDRTDPTPKPVAGELVVKLTSPNATDGALIVRVVGPVTDVTPVGSYRVSFTTQGNMTRAIITGDIVSGDLLRIKVPDVSALDGYFASVEQAASRIDYALFSTSGYLLSVRAP